MKARLKVFVLLVVFALLMVGSTCDARADSRAKALQKQALSEYRNSKTRDLALRHINEALKLEPDSAEFWQNKALFLKVSDEGETALACIRRSIELDKKVDYSHALKSEILMSLNRSDEALRAINTAISLKSRPEYSVLKATILSVQGKLDLAEKQLDAVIKLNSHDRIARARRANVAKAARHWSKAIDDYSWLISAAPAKSVSYYDNLLDRSYAYLELKQYDKALADCKAGLAGMPTARQFNVALVKIYERSGNTSEARRARQALESVDDDLKPPKSYRFKD
ncbi:MAG: tetratricopeptide repeat protein [Candidatus Melainabacteria bacterium]|nr:tetratricopeptide repeat protein [Candidatus Melainabacteria bacterium]